MVVLENARYVCRYKYDGGDEEFQIESSSPRWLKEKMTEFAMDEGISYTIYAVIEEGYNKALPDNW